MSRPLAQQLETTRALAVRAAVRNHPGDRAAQAAELGVDRATLYRWIKALGLPARGYRVGNGAGARNRYVKHPRKSA